MPPTIVGKGGGPGSERHIHIGVLKELELRRQDADDQVRLLVEDEGTAKRVLGPELPPPKPFADDRDPRGTALILVRTEVPAVR